MRNLVISTMVAGAVLSATAAFGQQSGERKVMQGPATIVPAADGSVTMTYTEYTFGYYSAADMQQMRNQASASGVSDADLQQIIASMTVSLGRPPTVAEVMVRLAAIAAQNKQNAITAFMLQNGNNNPSTYGGAGGVAFRLAQELDRLGTGGDRLNFSGEWGGAAYDWATSTGRGWPLQAAMIHNPEFAAPGTSVSKQAMLEAWDIIWANVQAHGWSLGDPLVLDLNGNGKIDVTGRSSAKYRAKGHEIFVAQGSVMFDLLGKGKAVRTEWISGRDGFLIDNRGNKARSLVKAGQNLTIANLFGDADGHTGGFAKLAREFDPKVKLAALRGLPSDLGVLKGKSLADLLVWIDDGNGIAKPDELRSLKVLGITEIRLPAQFVKDKQGEILEKATFVRNGKSGLIQEVWFAHEKSAGESE